MSFHLFFISHQSNNTLFCFSLTLNTFFCVLLIYFLVAFRPKKIDESGSFPFIIETRQADRKHLLYTQDEQQRKKWVNLLRQTAEKAPKICPSSLFQSHTGHVTTRRLSLNAEDNVDSMKLNKKTRDRLLAEQLELKMKNHTKLLEEDLRKLEAIDDVELEQQLVKSIEEKKLGIEAMNDTLKSLRDEKEKPQLSVIASLACDGVIERYSSNSGCGMRRTFFPLSGRQRFQRILSSLFKKNQLSTKNNRKPRR